MHSSYGSPVFTVEETKSNWPTFVAKVPECALLANSDETLPCLRNNASVGSIFAASDVGERFQPTVDGPGGFIPDYLSKTPLKSAMPILIGSNLDEGAIDSSSLV